MIKVTWQEDENAPEIFTVPDSAIAAFEEYRKALIDLVGIPAQKPGGQPYEYKPKYSTVRDMIVGHFVETLVKPALDRFPPPELVALKDAADMAANALRTAREQAATSVLVSPMGMAK